MDSRITGTRSSPKSRVFMRHSKACCAEQFAIARRRSCHRSCGWDRGSAATAMAIRSSRRRRCPTPFTRRQALRFEDYLDQVHRLGAELSLSTRLVTPSAELLALAAVAQDANPHRQDEPYRQALVGDLRASRGERARARASDARARATVRRRGVSDAGRAAGGPRHDRRVARDARRFRAGRAAPRSAAPRDRRLRIPSGRARLAPEQRRPRSGPRRDARARRCRRSTTVSSPSPNALRCSRASSRARGRSTARISIIRSALRPSSPFCALPRMSIARYGAAAMPNYVISKCQSVSDLLEVAVLLKEVGLLRGSSARGQHRPAVRDDRRSRMLRRHHAPRRSPSRAIARWLPGAATGRR